MRLIRLKTLIYNEGEKYKVNIRIVEFEIILFLS